MEDQPEREPEPRERRILTPAVLASALFVAACATFAMSFVAARGGLQLPVAATPPPVALATSEPSVGPTPGSISTPAPSLPSTPIPTLEPTPIPTVRPFAVPTIK